MKKNFLLLMILINGLGFSQTCKWISDKPSFYEKKIIDMIKNSRMESKVYCDIENDRMVYQTGNEEKYPETLEIGLIYNNTEKKKLTYEKIFEYILQFYDDVEKLNPVSNLSDREYSFSPKYYNYRMYLYFPEEDDTIMVLKHTFDTDEGDWFFYYSSEFFDRANENEVEIIEYFEDIKIFSTEDIIY